MKIHNLRKLVLFETFKCDKAGVECLFLVRGGVKILPTDVCYCYGSKVQPQ